MYVGHAEAKIRILQTKVSDLEALYAVFADKTDEMPKRIKREIEATQREIAELEFIIKVEYGEVDVEAGVF